jgi:fucose permease
MPRTVIIVAIAACYFIFAVLLNSVGTVILQTINSFDISKPQASVLEGFKDISIAMVSFVIASFIPRMGYKIALLVGLSAVLFMSLLTPWIANFLMIKLLFAVIGASFALVKVSVYAIIGQLSPSTKTHSSLLNTIEGIFMLGSLSGYWLFSFYIEPSEDKHQWLDVYYAIAALISVALLLVIISPIKKDKQNTSQQQSVVYEFTNMLKMARQPLVIIFVVSIFLYVLIEQGIGTWLPTFNREILQLPVNISVQMTSIFAASLAVGRLLAGQILRYVNWYCFLNVVIVLMALLILMTLPLTHDVTSNQVKSVFDAPIAAYLLPLIGLAMAPIYPVLNSVMLRSLDNHKHAAMTGLIVVFSALGGTTGSIITGITFEAFGGQHAFYLSLFPMLLILWCIYLFRKATLKIATEQ